MAQVLYGALGGSHTTSDLYSIDPVTGTATSIGPIGDAISGLAFDPTDGTLYGATSNNSAANPRCLITIDPVTGARIAVIGQFSAVSTHLFSDIDFDSSGQLYGQATSWTPPGATQPEQVCAINKTNAAITPLTASQSLSNNAFVILRSTGKGYEPVSFLWEVDLASNGATTSLGALGGSGSFSAAAGSIDENDLLWTVSNDGRLRTVDLSTRVVTLGATTTALMDGIAWSTSSPVPPPSPYVVPQAASHPPTIWRWVICDLDGNPISIITGLAQNQEMLFLLNRPTLLTFDVPSDEPLINIQHTDGEPYLSCGNRMIKGYRKVANGPVETPGGWEIAYSGRVWILQDSGDGDSVRTSVTCYDWYNDLSRRTCRDGSGARFQDQSIFSFTSIAADQIIKQLIDNTNSYAATRLTTGSFSTCAAQSVSYDLAYIVPSITDLTNTGLVDLIPEYLDSIIGVHMQIGAAPRRGTDKSASIIFGYDAPPRISSGFDRTLTIENLANDITMYGNKRTSKSTGTSAGSITKYDTFELVDAEAEISSTSLLDDLVTEMVALRANPNETIGVIPAPHISPLFLTDFDIGDSVTINAATTPFPVTRQAVIGVQRIYGVRLVIDIDAGERITELVVSAQAE